MQILYPFDKLIDEKGIKRKTNNILSYVELYEEIKCTVMLPLPMFRLNHINSDLILFQ